MTNSVQVQASPIQDEVPVIQAQLNPIPQSVPINEEAKEDVINRRLYVIGICAFVVILCISLVVGFLGLRQ